MKKMKNYFITKIFRKKFVKDVAILGSGTFAAQFISMILIPAISRIYGPDAYGLMGTFLAIPAIISPVAALTLPNGIVLPKNDDEAIDLINASLKISMCISIFLFVILLFLYKGIAEVLNITDVSQFLLLIPVSIFFAGMNQLLRQWSIRKNDFKILSSIAILESMIIYGGMVVVGIFYPVATVLILFVIIKSILSGLLLLIAQVRKNDGLFKKIIVTKKPFKKIIYKYRDFPLFRAPQELINSSSLNLPSVILAAFFGPVAAGFYSISRSALGLPSQMIGRAVGDVFYARIAKAANNGENLTNLILNATYSLLGIGVLPFGVVIVFGPDLFGFIFGGEWIKAGEYARWISVWLLFMFANVPCIKAIPVLSAQKFHLKFTVSSLILRLLALSIGFFIFKSDLIAIIFFSLSGAILNILLIFKTLKLSLLLDMEARRN